METCRCYTIDNTYLAILATAFGGINTAKKQHVVAEDSRQARANTERTARAAQQRPLEATQKEKRRRGGALKIATTPATYRRASRASSDLGVAAFAIAARRGSAQNIRHVHPN